MLDCFLADGDHAAFEVLVARHGPMVLGVCRRLLVSPHDADDAFQATFLLLVRKARGLHNPDRLAPWLYGVATRVAIKARARSVRQLARHEAGIEAIAAPIESISDRLDVREILDAELGRLPVKLRDVLVMCLLEGLPTEEVARQLGCPHGTVKSRLARGREALQVRLTGRGVAPSIALAASSSAPTHPISATLTSATLGLLAGPPGSIAPGVAALTREVAMSMIMKSTVTASVVLGAFALAGVGMVNWMRVPARAQAPGRASAGNEAKPLNPRANIRTKRNMQMILLGFNNYLVAGADNTLPPAAISGADGQPKLSWRVALLPYLNQNDLYNEFHRDEPWDSPHNKALIGRMPNVFETPNSPAGEGMTRIRGFEGIGALFDRSQAIGWKDIFDGRAFTVLIASAAEAVPWTQPGELPFVAGQPIPMLDDSDAKGWIVGTADGAVRWVKKSDMILLRAMITRSGGELFEQLPEVESLKQHPLPNASIPGQPTTAVPMTRPTPPITAEAAMPPVGGAAPPLPPAVEQRLQRLEEKLDRVLQKLDALPTGADGKKP